MIFARLINTLASPKVLALGKNKCKTLSFHLFFRSLNRTFVRVLKKIPGKMHKKTRFGMVVLLLLMASQAVGQDGWGQAKKVIRFADSLLYRKYYGADIDTTFIRRPETKWTVRLRGNVSGATVNVTGLMGNRLFEAKEHADFKNTINVGASYMGISLGLSVNPGLLLGRYKDYEINVNSYGNRFGFDFIYQRAKNFTGWIRFSEEGTTQRPRYRLIADDFWGEKSDLPRNMLTMSTLNINAYYAFNHRRFSYPAAFSQSYVQRRSAGSVLLAASYQGQDVDNKAIPSIGNSHAKLSIGNIALGAGYGYNFALPHNWLLHISAMPTFIVFTHNRFYLNDERQTMHYRFPEVIVTGRGAFVHSFDPYFCGLSMNYTFSRIGDENRLEIMNTKWRARAFVGVRF